MNHLREEGGERNEKKNIIHHPLNIKHLLLRFFRLKEPGFFLSEKEVPNKGQRYWV